MCIQYRRRFMWIYSFFIRFTLFCINVSFHSCVGIVSLIHLFFVLLNYVISFYCERRYIFILLFVIHWLKKQFVCFEYSSSSVESPSINFVFLPYLLYSICFIIYVLYINVRKRKGQMKVVCTISLPNLLWLYFIFAG